MSDEYTNILLDLLDEMIEARYGENIYYKDIAIMRAHKAIIFLMDIIKDYEERG